MHYRYASPPTAKTKQTNIKSLDNNNKLPVHTGKQNINKRNIHIHNTTNIGKLKSSFYAIWPGNRSGLFNRDKEQQCRNHDVKTVK